MKYVKLTPAQHALLKALYDQRSMRYLVYDTMGDAAVYTKKPQFDEASGFWHIPDLKLCDIEYLSYETVPRVAESLGIELQENPMPIFWLDSDNPIIPLDRLLALTANDAVTTIEEVLEST